MRIAGLLCGAVALLSTCLTTLAGDVPQLAKISEHVYAYVGTTHASPAGNAFGANAGVVVGRDAVLVVDTLVSAKHATRFLADIRKVTDKPIRYVVNTHWHLDHSWGNCVFINQGAVVIAHENSRQSMLSSDYTLARADRYGMTASDLEGTVLLPPAITFKQDMTIDLGGVTVQLNYPGAAHTSGSITAYVPQDKVLFVGDILFTRYHPNIGEGDLVSWQKVLEDLQKTPATQIIPGHGPVSTPAHLKQMQQYIQTFDTVARELCQGKSAADAPAIAQELAKRLPDLNRDELPFMIQYNLQARYLPKADAAK